MKYYGGREISEDDLKKALLVGMSPHERKLFGNTTQEGQVSSTVEVIPASLSSSNLDDAGELYASLRDKCGEEDVNDDMTEDTDVSSLPLCTDMDINMEVLAGDNKQITIHENGFSYTKLISNPEGTISAKHNPKPSLLDHGPHGNQIVEHMMREYGEEGIRQFCQKWRQVFVEAIHPRFLPGGWNVMHSSDGESFEGAFGKVRLWCE